jgi:hypothetical protein
MATETFTRAYGPLTVGEGAMLLSRLRHSTFLHNRGITLDVEARDEPIVMNDGSKRPAVSIKITADTAVACAMGYGFILAIDEGVHKLKGAS